MTERKGFLLQRLHKLSDSQLEYVVKQLADDNRPAAKELAELAYGVLEERFQIKMLAGLLTERSQTARTLQSYIN